MSDKLEAYLWARIITADWEYTERLSTQAKLPATDP